MDKEEYRWLLKVDRLQNRVQKVLTELAKSDINSEMKTELYECFWGFISGMCGDLEKEYPDLKQKADSGN